MYDNDGCVLDDDNYLTMQYQVWGPGVDFTEATVLDEKVSEDGDVIDDAILERNSEIIKNRTYSGRHFL